MDDFENYLLNRILDLKGRIEEENKSVVNDEVRNSVLFYLNNTLEEVVEILANYTLNYKIWG